MNIMIKSNKIEKNSNKNTLFQKLNIIINIWLAYFIKVWAVCGYTQDKLQQKWNCVCGRPTCTA